jgi:S-adenosylmethionine:tRNA ribosyltransferase-isomerase
MKAAQGPRTYPEKERLLVLERDSGQLWEQTMQQFPQWLRRGDVVVVNDAATLPASLWGRNAGGSSFEMRLISAKSSTVWQGLLFGEGDWRWDTEQRGVPPRVMVGESLEFGGVLCARVQEVDPLHPRLIEVEFLGTDVEIWQKLYQIGKVIQYSYVKESLQIADVQTRFAAQPWAMEMPSAGRPLTWESLLNARHCGVNIVSLTHATGLSSTGDRELDKLMPWEETFDLPVATVQTILRAKSQGNQVVAVGTTVARALEGCVARFGELVPRTATTTLRLGPNHQRQVVDGILTGMHEEGTSHFELLQCFVPKNFLQKATRFAEERNFLAHEFGDSMLIISTDPSSKRNGVLAGRY